MGRTPLELNADRIFDPDPSIRRIGRELYDGIKDLPLVCPHSHVDPKLFSRNDLLQDPTKLLVVSDPCIFRMLHSQGIPLDLLGIPRTDGSVAEFDPRDVWKLFADFWYLFRGTPTAIWMEQLLHDVFGIRERLSPDSALDIYDAIATALATPEFLPRSLFDRFNIEVLATNNPATGTLTEHEAIRSSGWAGRVIPTFRPDSLFRIGSPGWRNEIDFLSISSATDIDSYRDFIDALENRRAEFRSLGGTATDHCVASPFAERLPSSEADRLFSAAMSRRVTRDDERRFEAHMLMESARMSIDDGMVMQIHPGVLYDHNEELAGQFGRDKGGDIPIGVEYTRRLHALLNTYGNDLRLTLIVFTLDESTYARELAPLAGVYPALRLGAPWWFNDSVEGMARFRASVTETAGIYNTAGFTDDIRSFWSIPARHDLARRVDANWLAGLVTRHILDLGDAREMAHALAYDIPRATYKLDQPLTG